jgi:flagellar basal-body rod protein FlgF
MATGIYTAMAGAVAQSEALDTVSNNVANATTTGYRAERVRFGEALSAAKGKSTAFVQAKSGITDTQAGPQVATGNPLDLAIQGEGYFVLQTPKGERLTRAGNFSLNAAGQITSKDGSMVMGVNKTPIDLGTNKAEAGLAHVTPDGNVHINDRVVGQIDVRNYDAKDLKREGDSTFSTTAKPIVGPRPQVASGQIEEGNFNVVTGMVDLIRISRTYESLHRMIEGQKQMDDSISKLGS